MEASPELLAFLGAIKEAPDDDMPRLILADWLDDRGDPRAELLRLTVRMAHTIPGSSEGHALRDRERQLIRAHGEEWLGPILPLVHDWVCVRGLMRLTLHPETFCTELRKLVGTEYLAWVDGVRLRGLGLDDFEEVAECEVLAGLTALNLGGNDDLYGQRLRVLLGSAHLGGLKELDLYCNLLGPAGGAVLAAWPGLQRLTFLNLDGCRLGDDGARSLLTAGDLPRMTHLLMRSNQLTPSGEAVLRARLGDRVELNEPRLRGYPVGRTEVI